jgi:hypothetical protein
MLCENTVKGVFLIGHYMLKNMLNIDLFIWQHVPPPYVPYYYE